MLLLTVILGMPAAEPGPTLEQRVAQLEQAAKAAPAVNSGDNAWMLVSSALVLMMTAPGLILFYGGLVRTKNVLSTMMHSLVLMALMSAVWMTFGYSMAFGEGNAFFGNPLQYFFLKGVGIRILWGDLVFLFAYGAIVFFLATRKLRQKVA